MGAIYLPGASSLKPEFREDAALVWVGNTPWYDSFGRPTAISGAKQANTPTGVGAGFGSVYGTGTSDKIVTGLTQHASLRTYIVKFLRSGPGGGPGGRLIDKRTGATQAEVLYIDSIANRLTYAREMSSTQGNWGSSFTASENNVYHTVVVTYDSSSASNSPLFFMDGKSISVSVISAPSGTPVTNTDSYVIGNRADDSARNFDGVIELVVILDSLVPPAVAESISSDPYHYLFESSPRRIYFDLGAGGGALTATLSGSGAVVAVLSGRGLLSANVASQGTAAGALFGRGTLSLTSSGAASSSFTLSGKGLLTAAWTAVGTLSGTLSGGAAGSVAATLPGSGTLLGALSGRGALAAAVTGAGGWQGALAGNGNLSAIFSGAGGFSGALSSSSSLSVTCYGSTAFSGALTGRGALVATVAGSSTLSLQVPVSLTLTADDIVAIANAVWAHPSALTLGKFLALK